MNNDLKNGFMEWKNIKGYEGLYVVSDTGIVKGLQRYVPFAEGKKRLVKERVLVSRINNYGYVTVRLSKMGETKTCFVHRLVASAFIDNPDKLPQVNHISGDKLDNTPANLEWVNASENSYHAYREGLNKHCGGNHTFAVGIVDVNTGETYESIKALCRYYNINYNTGRNALNGYSDFPKHLDLGQHSFSKITA
jgi:hypothetical protein